tara:strand:- start:1950 stop:2831 length:882 start_codon:yes stop_codon:yes gene_type:complete
MQKILKFTQFPPGPVPEGYIYYNRTTRQIKLSTDLGERTFDASYISADIDALSINGYYPLYRNEHLAREVSPNNSAILYNEANLGVPEPAGVNYPVFLPVGIGTYQGDHIDPEGDSDGDGVLNLRDVDHIGFIGLPTPGWAGVDPFITSDSVSVNVKSYLPQPDQGYYNNLGRDLSDTISIEGIIIAPDGTVTNVSAGNLTLPAGYTLFLKEVLTPTAGSSATSIQWFENDGLGNLVLRDSEFNSTNPAVHLWESVGDHSYSPRDSEYSSTTESAQFFEEDSSGNLQPSSSPN